MSPHEPLFGDVSSPPDEPPPPSSRTRRRSFSVSGATRAGVGMGSALAITISWSVHKSILWAIVHGFLSWVYVAYYALTR
ncbi:MAG: hypothetical protein ACJ79S_18085 [Gemmatimonadaceae bacterium]